jgi:hypothetical protein
MDATNRPHPGHETTDIDVWAVGKFAIGMVLLCVIVLALLFGLMRFFQSREETRMATSVDPVQLFPEPRLQTTPVPDLKAVRAEEDKLLNGYAWLDQKRGLVRIPIGRAMDVVAAKGLPVLPLSAPPQESKK